MLSVMNAQSLHTGRVVGRYVLFDELASGGMATVHLGRFVGGGGFSRTVAIKRLHPHIAKDPDFRSMMLDEARIVSRISHTHVVPTLDVIAEQDELLLVMEYVHGEPVSGLLRASRLHSERLPARVSATIVAQALYGLHAAHEAKDDRGQPLWVVHRDVSPHNILVGIDGVTRVLDFGVAKAAGRIQSTREGTLKGKLPYMSPEQILARDIDRRTDIYAASVVLWELLTGRPLFRAENEAATIQLVLYADVARPSTLSSDISPELDALVMRGLSRDRNERFGTALEMAEALSRMGFATAGEVGALVRTLGGSVLEKRGRTVSDIESRTLAGYARPDISEPVLSIPAHDTMPLPTAVHKPNPQSDAHEQSLSSAPALGTSARPPEKQGIPRAALYVLAAFLLVFAATAGGFWMGKKRVKEQEISAGAGVPTSLPLPEEAKAPPSSSSAEPQSSAANEIKEAPAPSASASGPARAKSALPSKPWPKAGKNCNPPYTVDADGIRTPKPECL